MGTASYMSPEQVRNEELDTRTDLFSAGLVLYEMATGRQAFGGETAAEVHRSILNDTPEPARRLNPELPQPLTDIINKAIEKDRALRYQTASEMGADLLRLKANTRQIAAVVLYAPERDAYSAHHHACAAARWEDWFMDPGNLERALQGAGLSDVGVHRALYTIHTNIADFL